MDPSTLQMPSYATVSRGPSQDVSVHARGDDKGEPVKLESWSHIRHLGDRRRVQNMNAQVLARL
jgi:hypothetical protein